MQTRIRQHRHGWMVDRRFLWLFWLPTGRWIHQDWWAPYLFDSASEAEAFVAEIAPPVCPHCAGTGLAALPTPPSRGEGV